MFKCESTFKRDNNAAKNFNILATCLNVLHNYFRLDVLHNYFRLMLQQNYFHLYLVS